MLSARAIAIQPRISTMTTDPTHAHAAEQATEVITLGGGCFWCTEAVYLRVRGVVAVESGYCNGRVTQPTYEQVCSGTTGHAEVVKISFDPRQINLTQLLEIFFAIHNPTTLNQQGHDVGTQYRSGIYCSDAAQLKQAQAMVSELNRTQVFGKPAVTEVLPLANYWPAESYHQNYFAQHPNQGYCAMVVGPKVDKFRKTFAQWVVG